MRTVNLQKGFSLVELAVVLGIVGIVAIGSVGIFSEQRVHAKWQEGGAKLGLVKQALLQHAHFNKFLPCPDTDAVGNLGYGFENRDADNSCTRNWGEVPFRSIDLSEADVEDSWGNKLHYAITQNASNPANIINNCPVDSACFFNNVVPPAFDLTTLPVMGNPGIGNLRICNLDPCNAGTANANIVGDDFIAVLVAFNENGTVNAGLGAAETENQDNNAFFVQARYSENPYFDDLIVSISANEIKTKQDMEANRNEIAVPAGAVIQRGNTLNNMGNNTLGTSGTNIGTNNVIWDTNTQTFNFGAEAAGKEIVLTFDTHAVGTWDQPSSPSSSVTSDTAYVKANGDEQVEFAYDYRDSSQDGVELVTWQVAQSGTYTEADENGNLINVYRTAGETATGYADYWDQSHEYIVNLDANGQVSMDFGVGTTATYETIDFENIELLYYNSPPPVPAFPGVLSIAGIPQTQELK